MYFGLEVWKKKIPSNFELGLKKSPILNWGKKSELLRDLPYLHDLK